jgi:hypothetical protein
VPAPSGGTLICSEPPRTWWTHQVSYLPQLTDVESAALPPMRGVFSYRMAFDSAGAAYHAFTTGEQTVAPAKPRTHLTVVTPSLCLTVTASHDPIQLLDLAADGQGDLYLLYSRKAPYEKAARLVYYALSAKGATVQLELPWHKAISGDMSLVEGTLDEAALALDPDGEMHVAVMVTPRGAKPSARTLVVGATKNRIPSLFSVVERGLPPAAFDLAAERGVSTVAYFDDAALKVRRVCH